MKWLILFCAFFSLWPSIQAQQSGFRYFRDSEGNIQLLGQVERKDIETRKDFWTDSIYNVYQPHTEKLLRSFGREMRKISIEIYMGTWSEACMREIPQFLKLLDQIHFPPNRVSIFALDNRDGFYLHGKNSRLPDQTIFQVPTIVFNYNGKELDRIIGGPVKSYADDLYDIFWGGKNYLPNAPLAYILAKNIETMGFKAVRSLDSCGAIQIYQELVANAESLKNLGRMYMDQNKKDEAEYCLITNTRLYPNDESSWSLLAKYYTANGAYNQAIKCLENIIIINPDNLEAKRKMKSLENNGRD